MVKFILFLIISRRNLKCLLNFSVINADEPSDDDDDDDDDEGMEETEDKITTSEALDCFQKIETYIEKAENTPDIVFKAMIEINNVLKKTGKYNAKASNNKRFLFKMKI